MKVVKITVLDRLLRSDLVAEYGDPALKLFFLLLILIGSVGLRLVG